MRHEKGIAHDLPSVAGDRAAALIVEITGARIASSLALGTPMPDTSGEASYDDRDGVEDARWSGEPTTGFAEGQRRIRGLFSGGSLAGEAKLLLKSALGTDAAQTHEILDLGDDQYTVGRPHPMIDPRLRNEMIEMTAADPTVAVILLDVVLGTGANPDPAGVLVPAIAAAQATASRHGRRLVIVASVCGTDGDPQGLADQERTLAAAGVVLAPSNARAARIAASISASLSVTTIGGAA